MGESCSSLSQGILAYSNVDIISNGFITENAKDRQGRQIKQLPSNRISVELQYSVRSDMTGTSINSLSPGGNAGFISGSLGGGAGFAIGAAIGCSLLGDIEPTRSRFVFHVCEAQTKINRSIIITQGMIDEAQDNDGICTYTFSNEYPIGILSVTKEKIIFTEEEEENIGSGQTGIQRGHNISSNGQIEASFSNFNYSSELNMFIEIVRDARKLKYRADNNVPGDNLSGVNCFVSGSLDDLTDTKIKIRLFDEESESSENEVEVGDILYITYSSAQKRSFRHAIFASSTFFLFPGFLVEKLSDQVKAWTFRPYKFKAHKDLERKSSIEDIIRDEIIEADATLTIEQKSSRKKLETIECQRIVECVNDTKNQRPYIRGIYFADTRGILCYDYKELSSEPQLLVPRNLIRDQQWFDDFIASFVDFGPGFNSSGHLDPTSQSSARLLRGFVFDISDHVNSVCYDNDKFGYQRDFAIALSKVSSFDPSVEASGIGFPNLDLIRNKISRRDIYDLSSVKFAPVKMSSIEGGAYFIRDCNRFFTYDQALCSNGTLQADMFIRTPFFFEELSKKTRIYVERFTPQFALAKDGGIWVSTRPISRGSFSVDTLPFREEACLVFSADNSLNYHKLSDSQAILQTRDLNFDILDTSKNHDIISLDQVRQNAIDIIGYDQIIGNQPGYSRGLEITKEGGQISLGILNRNDIYENVIIKNVGTPNFSVNSETKEITVQGLQNKKIKSIKMFFSPDSVEFLNQKNRLISFVFQNNRRIIDNIALPYEGGVFSNRERFVYVDARGYFDDSIKIIGDILKYITPTKFEITFIKDDKYEDVAVVTSNFSNVIDGSGVMYIFYEDEKSNIGSYGDQPIGPILDSSFIDISCLVSYDQGQSWFDFKGIVYTVGDEVIRNPYAVCDKQSNIIHLFYVLNDCLMNVSIDTSSFTTLDAYKAWKRPATYDKDTNDLLGINHFTKSGQMLRKRESSIVVGNIVEGNYIYDQLSVSDYRRKQKESNKLTYRFSYSGDRKNFEDSFPETNYVAFLDGVKTLRVLYTSNGKLYGRLSSGSGYFWEDIIPDGMFIHKNVPNQEPKFISSLGINLDERNEVVNILYVVDNMLFVRSINVIDLSVNSDIIESTLDPDDNLSKPMFVVGEISDEMESSIISRNASIHFPYIKEALGVFDEKMAISDTPSRGYTGNSGLSRFFYTDSNGEIRGFSMISNNILLDSKSKPKDS